MSTRDVEHVETAITAYRDQLTREAELGRSELDELEDHLRALVADLRATGMPAAAAVTEAARRLGDPAALARESARVRTAFGARLPAWRAWGAIALMAPLIVALGSDMRLDAVNVAQVLIAVVLATALGLRLAWSRAVLFGAMVYNVGFAIASKTVLGVGPPVMFVVLQVGAAVLLAPWRRRELSSPGIALALLYPTFVAASWMAMFTMTAPSDGSPLPDAQLVMLGTVVAGAGIVLRARWAAIALLATTVLLAAWTVLMTDMTWRVNDGEVLRGLFGGFMIAGIAAALVATAIAWRTARSNLGSLRGVLA